MTYNTISNDKTVAGGEGTLLVNRYRIVRQLGQGGMGSVWLAEDTQLDNKPFAIKMLPSILVSNKRAYRQLKDEALVAMKLTHPNIVTLRAFEENNGNPFLVMDYIDGQTLDDYLAEHTGTTGILPVGHDSTGTTGVSPVARGLPESEVLRIMRPIAAALDYAHAKGIVHRDVKPGNVMIAKDGTPYILDFGIAREIQETMTRVTGKLSSGTLLYMSPEQLMGEQPTPAQDVYSFAAMAYECLKGEPPFSHGQIEFQIMNKQPEPLVGRVVPNAPQSGGTSFCSSVMSGLAKKPESRPASCTAVLEKRIVPVAPQTKLRAYPQAETGSSRMSRLSDPQPSKAGAPPQPQGGGTWKVLSLAIVLGLAVVCCIMWWGVRKETPRKTARTERPSKIEDALKHNGDDSVSNKYVKAQVPNGPTRAEVAEIAVQASVQKKAIAHIDGADGFSEKKDELSALLRQATSFGKARQWKESAQAFSNYVERCKALVRLNDERMAALKNKEQAKDAFQKAEAAGAKTYASTNWYEAVDIWEKATNQFGRMEFPLAGTTFTSAVEHFRKCIDEANTVKENDAYVKIQKAEDFVASLQKSMTDIELAERSLIHASRYKDRMQSADSRGITQKEVDDARTDVEEKKQALVLAREVFVNQCLTAPLSIPLRNQMLKTALTFQEACAKKEELMKGLTDAHPDVVIQDGVIHTALSTMQDVIDQAKKSLVDVRQATDALTALERDPLTFEFFKECLSRSLRYRLGLYYEAYYMAYMEKRTLLATYTAEHPAVKAASKRADDALAKFKKTVRTYKNDGLSSAPKCPDTCAVGANAVVQDERPLSTPETGLTANTDDGTQEKAGIPATGLPFDHDSNYVQCADVTFAPVYFGFDVSNISSSELLKIEAVAVHIQKTGHVVIIEGHANESSNEYCLSLGETRAIAIRNYLMKLGINPTKIQTRSYGKEKPAVLGHGEDALSKNRRCEFMVFEHK